MKTLPTRILRIRHKHLYPEKSLKQKFHKGDVVRIAKDLGSSMSHFPGAGQLAVVVGSYNDKYPRMGSSNYTDYILDIPGRGETSWYHESQLTLVEKAP